MVKFAIIDEFLFEVVYNNINQITTNNGGVPMACIVYQTNKKTNTKYAYRSESYRDPVTKKPKSRRTYLGRVDLDTNEIIPKAEKGKRNRSAIDNSSPESKNNNSSAQTNIGELRQLMDHISETQYDLMHKIADMDESISKIRSLLNQL